MKIITLVFSTLIFVLLLYAYEWAVLSSDELVKGLVVGGHRRRKRKVVSGAGILMIIVLMLGGYGWGAETTIISFMVIVGFIDDWTDVFVPLRLLFYFIGVLLIHYGQGWFHSSLPILFCVVFLYLGFVNAVNFIDGINGMVVMQSIVIVSGMLFSSLWNESSQFLVILLGFLLAFSFFNFRLHARLYLGDAGSIGLGFVLMGLVLWKIHLGASWGYLLYFSVIIVEAGSTLILRLLRGENIFRKHRLHLYQKLTHESGWNPLLVSTIYALVQLSLIVFWEFGLKSLSYNLYFAFLTFSIYSVIYAILYFAINAKIARKH